MFETLVERNPHGPGVVPLLASSWDTTADSITFHLRRNVQWHDGTWLTAHDVAFTVQVILDSRSASPLRDELSFVRRVQILDPYSVRFHLRPGVDEPVQAFLGLYVMPRHRFRIFEKSKVTANEIYLVCRFKNVQIYQESSLDSEVSG